MCQQPLYLARREIRNGSLVASAQVITRRNRTVLFKSVAKMHIIPHVACLYLCSHGIRHELGCGSGKVGTEYVSPKTLSKVICVAPRVTRG